MGRGRSGSTFLETVLSDYPQVFGSGELFRSYSSRDNQSIQCSCGATPEKCHFWTEVWRQWGIATGLPHDSKELDRLESRFKGNRNSPMLARHSLNADDQWHRYLSLTRELFKAIQTVSGAEAIIDSSKRPNRALALSWIEDVDLRVIHLVRDVRGVACSRIRKTSKRPIDRAISWHRCNRKSNRVRKYLGSTTTMLLRYEDLVADPKTSLGRLSDFTGLDFELISKKLEQGSSFRSEHAIAGNRLRMQQTIQLAPDTRWRQELSPFWQKLLPLLTASTAWRYGYRPWG